MAKSQAQLESELQADQEKVFSKYAELLAEATSRAARNKLVLERDAELEQLKSSFNDEDHAL